MKTALITGASGGIGLEIARLFAQDGYNVILVARNVERLVRVKRAIEKRYGVKAFVFACDLTEEKACERVFKFVRVNSLEIDALVNNAGFEAGGVASGGHNYSIATNANVFEKIKPYSQQAIVDGVEYKVMSVK